MTENPSILTAQTLIATLLAARVPVAAYCPGSRNAPFAYALAQAEAEGQIRVGTFSDERSAGFWALGMAKALAAQAGQPVPVPVFTTSGTAVTELHSAVEEARLQGLALVVITADRPHELRGVGASQTTIQEGIFPGVVAASIPAGRSGERVATAAPLTRLLRAACDTPGPVHLNVAFADPLVPASDLVLPTVPVPTYLATPPTLPSWDEVVDPSLWTVVVAGDSADPAVIAAATARQVPILAEPSSGATASPSWVPHTPLLLRYLYQQRDIQQVVVTGRPTLSRPVVALLGRHDVRKIVVSPRADYPDQSYTAQVVVAGLAASDGGAGDPGWLATWRAGADCVGQVVAEVSGAELNLLAISRLLWASQPEVALWLSASNAVRGFDLAAASPARAQVYANRGLAGIDGTVASALGLASGLGRPVRAVIGDLAFAADLSTLVQQPGLPADLQVVVLNDGGGSIFASLEHGGAPADLYERYFAVAPRMDVVALAEAAGWRAERVSRFDELEPALAAPVSGRSVIEVVMPRPDALLRELAARTEAALSRLHVSQLSPRVNPEN
ncbi:2-succinyl-5-enolpyruvyl-6-hydroxy-3-cyclohexene-1-carboxylic-acid synthase [Scrofimicrobium sp. R131]|uniref:2-succinyl-5-enolpyruvyl-6-hydroxy-3-cyclohexene-1-carboxylate synthase n=1 Tax=Scrofimicrobium appendicitidis TaxID=3079930 RepID=A0AAU7V8W9_9ACTO